MANVWNKMQRADADYDGIVTGKLNNVAAATVTSNAAAGASRNTIFRTGSVPTANAAGDSWFDTANNNKVYIATAAGDNQIGSGEWIDTTPDKTAIGLGSVTNDAQIKSDGSNAPDSLKNSEISLSAAGVLSGAGGGTITPAGLGVIKTDGTNAPNSLKNSQITLTADSGTVTLNNAGSGSFTKSSIGLGNVSNVTAPTTFSQDDVPTSLAVGDLWIDTNDSNKMYRAAAAGADEVKAGEWVALTLQKAALGLVKADVGLTNVDDKSSETIRGELTKANVTDTGLGKADINLGNVANESPATLKTTMALNNVTNESKATMFGSPTFTGTVAGVTATHVGLGNVENRRQITSFAQDDAPNATGAGDLWTDTNDNNKMYRASAAGTGNWVALSLQKGALGLDKTDVGLDDVVNQKITINSTSKGLEINDVAQDLNATKLGGDSSATIKAAAVSTAETNIVGASPGTLDTLTKIKTALNDDTGFNTTITNSIATKQKAPMTITANDAANSSYDNDPSSEAQGQIGVYNGHLYQVVDV